MITNEEFELKKAKLADFRAKIFVLENKIDSYCEGKNPGWFENVMLCRAKVECLMLNVTLLEKPAKRQNILIHDF